MPRRLERPPWCLLADDGLPEALARAWLEAPEGLVAAAGDGTAEVASELGPLTLKRDASRPLRRLARRLGAARSRAVRAFELARELRAAGVPTPRAWAALEGPRDALLVLERRPGRDLDQLLRARAALVADPARRDALWRALAATVARLHAAGFRQRDLKAPNVLVELEEPDVSGGSSPPKLALLDLDGVRRTRGVPRARVRRADLGRLAASLLAPAAAEAGLDEDDVRALARHYAASLRGHAPHVREGDALERAVLVRARAKLARNRRLGRPTA